MVDLTTDPQQGKSNSTSPVSTLKRPRESHPPSLTSPKFDPMKLFRLARVNNKDVDSPARKVRKVDPPECKPEECLIKVKQEKDLLETSSESSDYSSESSKGSTSRSPKWKAFGCSVLFTSTPTRTNRRPTSSPPCQTSTPFCFNCKRYGHLRQVCNSPWNNWWPQAVLQEYPWIRRKIAELRVIRLKRNYDYKRLAIQLDREVEAADRKKKMNANYAKNYPTQNRYGRPWYATAAPRSPAGKALFQNLPKALIMENIQNAINELQQTLSQLRSQ